MTADIVSAVAGLMWPLLLLWAVWRLGPVLREVMRERDVHAKGGPAGVELSVGGQPVSTQKAVDDQRREIEGVRAELSLLAAQVVTLSTRVEATRGQLLLGLSVASDLADPAESLTAAQSVTPRVRRILWVDDQPATNAYELAALRDRGIDVIEVLSTEDALRRLSEDSAFDGVVTDMHRREAGQTRPEAGLQLLRTMRQQEFDIPVVVYTSLRSAERYGTKVRELGAVGATAAASELFELLGVNFGPRLALRIRAEVQQVLSMMDLTDLHEPDIGGLDFLGSRDSRRIGIEVKPWLPPIDTRALEGAIARLANLVQRNDIDEAWLVSAEPLSGGASAPQLPEYVRLFTIDELRQMPRR